MARQARTSAASHDEFLFRVRGPSASYSFSLRHDRWIDDPYREQLSLSFVAECLYPERFEGRAAEAQFFADDELTAGSETRRRKPEEPPKAVGSVMIGRGKFEVGGFLPPAVCWNLCKAMANGTITSMGANGLWIKRGHAYLRSVSFHGPAFDPVAYIG